MGDLPSSKILLTELPRETSESRKKSFFESFQRRKVYLDMSDLSDLGFNLAWNLHESKVIVPISEFSQGKFDVYHTRTLMGSDNRLGVAKKIFQYVNKPEFFLEYASEKMIRGSIEKGSLKNILLGRNENDFVLSYGFYLIKN